MYSAITMLYNSSGLTKKWCFKSYDGFTVIVISPFSVTLCMWIKPSFRIYDGLSVSGMILVSDSVLSYLLPSGGA